MNKTKTFVIVILSIISLVTVVCVMGQSFGIGKRKKNTSKTPSPSVSKSMNKNTAPKNKAIGDYRILAEGFYSEVSTPFVFVARDAETYDLLKNLIGDLPASSTVDFKKNAVVAAFAGEKNTGGYSVVIFPAPGNKTAVNVQSPPKGGMTTQVITSPYLVAAVPIEAGQPVSLELPANWNSFMKTFSVSNGDFSYSGGIAGRVKNFNADGTITAMSQNNLTTYNFNLSGTGTNRTMKLTDAASGAIKDGKVEIKRLETGTFAEMPHPPLRVFGTADETGLSLIFESHPPMISDGFTARGTLKALKGK